jgi:hypothetical protein
VAIPTIALRIGKDSSVHPAHPVIQTFSFYRNPFEAQRTTVSLKPPEPLTDSPAWQCLPIPEFDLVSAQPGAQQ